MHRDTFLLSLAAIAVGAFVGCGSNGSGTTSGTTGHPAGSSAASTGSGGAGGTGGTGAGTTSSTSSGTTGSTGSTGATTSSSSGTGGSTGDYVACPTGQFPTANQLQFGSGGTMGAVISSDTTWTKDNLYIVVGNLLVEGVNMPTLTVEAGTTICFAFDTPNDRDGSIDVGRHNPGGLVMNGTAAAPITLTSAAGADTWWGAITGLGYTQLSLSYVDFYNASDGGGQGVGAIIAMANAGDVPAMGLDHVTFHQLNAGEALDLENHIGLTPTSQVTVTSFVSPATTMQYAVVKADPISAASLLPGMLNVDPTKVPAALRHIRLAEYTLTTSVTWHDAGMPFHTYSDFSVEQGMMTDPIPALTLSPGVVWNFDAGTSFLVGGPSGYSADVVAQGTAASPVTFGAIDQTMPWGGLHFMSSMASGYGFSPNVTVIDHAVLQYGGSGSNYGEVNCHDPDPSMTSTSKPAEVMIDGATTYQGPTITNTQFSHSAGDAVRAKCDNANCMTMPDYTAAATGNTFNNIAGSNQLMPLATCP